MWLSFWYVRIHFNCCLNLLVASQDSIGCLIIDEVHERDVLGPSHHWSEITWCFSPQKTSPAISTDKFCFPFFHFWFLSTAQLVTGTEVTQSFQTRGVHRLFAASFEGSYVEWPHATSQGRHITAKSPVKVFHVGFKPKKDHFLQSFQAKHFERLHTYRNQISHTWNVHYQSMQ